MTECGICKGNDSGYNLYSREINFGPTHKLKEYKILTNRARVITSEMLNRKLFENWEIENMDMDNYDYVQIYPFVICKDCFQKRFGFEQLYGFGPHKVDDLEIQGEISLSSLDLIVKSLGLKERNIDNWNEISKLPVVATAKLSHDIVTDTDIQYNTFNNILEISKKISILGIEGRRIGTAFIIGGDIQRILEVFTEQIVLNPFGCCRDFEYDRARRDVNNNDNFLKDSIVAFSQLDGIFIISNEGVVEAAGRRIRNMDNAPIISLQGKGTRHHSVATLTSMTAGIGSVIGVVVSQSGPITIYKRGRKCGELKNLNDYTFPE